MMNMMTSILTKCRAWDIKMDHFEKKYNELRSAFDMNKRALDDGVMIMEELSNGVIDMPVKTRELIESAAKKQKTAVTIIGSKCGYSE